MKICYWLIIRILVNRSSTIRAEDDYGLISKFKAGMVSMLVGNRQGFTIIGPAAIIKEIKKDPTKVQLFTVDKMKKRRR